MEHKAAINELTNTLHIERKSSEGIARERKKMSRQLLLTEKDLNISKDDIRRAESIIHEKDEIIKRYFMFY